MLRVSFDKNTKTFICQCSFDEREYPKSAGFFWSPVSKKWETKHITKAVRLREFFDESAKEYISGNSLVETPWSGGSSYPCPKNQELLLFQKAAVAFALSRNHSYLALEQGLGKTPIGVVLINALKTSTVIICPPFLVANWKRELSIWRTGTPSDPVSIASSREAEEKKAEDVVIIPDSLIDSPAVQDFLASREYKLLLVDEAHRFKNMKTKRSLALYEKIIPNIPKVVFLSGTPMPNRPMELYAPLRYLAHDLINFQSMHDYGVRYCAAYQHSHGWDYSGASNLIDLSRKIKPFMLRYTKAEMLTELLPKEERIVVIDAKKGSREVRKLEFALRKKFGESLSTYLEKGNLGDLVRYRREVGELKIPHAIDYVENIIENSDEKFLVYAWHTDTIDALSKAFNCPFIDGRVPVKEREKLVTKFQEGKHRMMVGQISTMVGYTLTRAKRVIFVEASWSPTDNQQAADRIHRIGQDESVLIDYLVLADTIDERIIRSFVMKEKVQARVGLGR